MSGTGGRRRIALVALALCSVLALSACAATSGGGPGGAVTYGKRVSIAVVTHGSPVDPFWSTVKQGAEQAAKDFNVALDYEAPPLSGTPNQATLINQAVARHPEGMAVSIPDLATLTAPIEGAVRARIPLVALNVGEDSWQQLGALDFIGQDEMLAGQQAGEQMAAAGVKHALCVSHEQNNVALETRCRGMTQAMQKAGATVTEIHVNGNSFQQTRDGIGAAIDQDRSIDGIVVLGPPGFNGAVAALQARQLVGKMKLATFDTSPDILNAVQGGSALFAIDQQPYLQGYFSVQILAQQVRYGLHPFRQIFTGPSLVTQDNVAQAIAFEQAAGNGQLSQIQPNP